MVGDDPKLDDLAAGQGRQDPPRTPRQVYEEIKEQFHIHYSANKNLEKKAQNLIIASALAGSLIVTLTAAQAADRFSWDLSVQYAIIVPTLGAVVAIAMCIAVNRTSAYHVAIEGKELLSCDRLDEKAYSKLLKNDEDLYKSRIKECAQALVKLEKTNVTKSRMLRSAYAVFLTSLGLPICVSVYLIVS